jgi:hypothetical protein
MSMLRKSVLLAGMALLATVLAVPASASAYEWLHEGNPLEGEAEIELAGTFNVPGLFDCPAAKVEIIAEEDNGTVTSFAVEDATKKCKTTGGYALIGCKVKEVIPDDLPWKVEVNALSIAWKGVKITHKLEECLFPYISIEGEIQATPDFSEAFSTVSLSGSMTTDTEEEASLEGEMEASAAETYGIG